MIRVQGPDGHIIEFPDGTSDDVMSRAMREFYGRQPTAPAQQGPAEPQPPKVGEDWRDPSTGNAHRVIDGASFRKPGEMTLADVQSRQRVLASGGARPLPSSPAEVGPTELRPFDPAQAAKAANDPAFVSDALAKVGPGQRALAERILGAQRAMERGPIETFGREAVNTFGLGLPRRLTAALTGDNHEVALAADARGREMNPGAAMAGSAAGWLSQALAIPGAAVATPARAAATGAALAAAPEIVEKGDPAAALRAALLGGAVGAIGRGMTYQPPPATPSAGALKQAAREGYEALGAMGVRYGDNAYRDLTGRMGEVLKRDGFDPDLHPKVRRVMERMQERQGGASLDDLRADRRLLADVGTSPDERRLAGLLRREVDGFIERADPATMTGGATGEAARLLKDANANYAAAMRSEGLQAAMARGERTAGAAATGSEAGALRRRAAAVLNSDRASRGLNDGEREALEGVVKGTAAQNLARLIGGFGPQNPLTTMASAAGGTLINPLALMVPAVGMAAQKLSDRSTRRAFEAVDDMTRQRSPLADMLRQRTADPNEGRNRALVRLLLGASGAEATP